MLQITAPVTSTQIDLSTYQSDCMQEVTKFGSTVYVNVCRGSQMEVPWGGVDWILMACVLVAAVTVVGFTAVSAIKLLFDL